MKIDPSRQVSRFSHPQAHLTLRLWIFAATLACLALAPAPASAVSSAPELLASFGEVGSGAGQIDVPSALAADPVSGHVYVGSRSNNRIEEFTVWGEFVKAWGWGVDDGAAELQTCTAATGCQQGIAGSEPSQLSQPSGIAVDSAGNVYVADYEGHSVKKFGPAGNFLFSFGGVGVGPGQFSSTTFGGMSIAIGPDGTIYVGDKGRIQKFDSSGNYTGEITGAVAGETAYGLAVGAAGIYATFSKEGGASKEDVRKLSPTGVELAKLPAQDPRNIAVDGAGYVYAVNLRDFKFSDGNHIREDEVLEFDPSGACVVCNAKTPAESEENFASLGVESNVGALLGIATNTVTGAGGSDLYVGSQAFEGNTPLFAKVTAYGPGPDKWPPRPPRRMSPHSTPPR